MGIKCSLLGHDFGDATVERDREEQGSEVVITIREIETCSRCGETRVVSENKEVTSLATPEDVEGPAAEPDADDREDEAGGPRSSSIPDTEDEGEIVEAEADGETGESTGSEEPPVTDDAEILDEESGPDREPGEWPQEAEEEDDADEAFDQFEYSGPEETPEAGDDDAEFIDADEESVRRKTNAWPSEDEPEREPTGPGAITVPEGTFVCNACGFSTPVESSSLREGDYCPECHESTLVQITEERRNE